MPDVPVQASEMIILDQRVNEDVAQEVRPAIFCDDNVRRWLFHNKLMEEREKALQEERAPGVFDVGEIVDQHMGSDEKRALAMKLVEGRITPEEYRDAVSRKSITDEHKLHLLNRLFDDVSEWIEAEIWKHAQTSVNEGRPTPEHGYFLDAKATIGRLQSFVAAITNISGHSNMDWYSVNDLVMDLREIAWAVRRVSVPNHHLGDMMEGMFREVRESLGLAVKPGTRFKGFGDIREKQAAEAAVAQEKAEARAADRGAGADERRRMALEADLLRARDELEIADTIVEHRSEADEETTD